MADQPTITNSDTSEMLTYNGVFRDRSVTVGAGEALAQYTVLGVKSGTVASAGSQTTIALAANLAALIAISDGEFTLTVDGGTPANITGVDMSSDTSIAEVAATLDAAVTAEGVTVTVENGDRIVFTSDTTGASSSVALTTLCSTGTDISTAATLNFADLTTVAGAAAVAATTVICASDATDGSDYPRSILMEALDNSSGGTATEFDNIQVMVEGEFDQTKIVFDNGTDTIDTETTGGVTMKDAMKTEGLIATFRQVEDELDNQ